MVPVTHLQNLRQLAERQDTFGVFARGKLKLILLGDALRGQYDNEGAVEWWRLQATFVEELVDLVPPDASARLREFAGRLRVLADALEEVDP